jgi:hypothetical protein
VDPNPEPDPGRQNDRQKLKKIRNLNVLKYSMFSLRAEGWIQIRIGIQPKKLDPDPEPINPDSTILQNRFRYGKLPS